MGGHTITHLSFEFDPMRTEVRLPPNKKLRASTTTQALLEAKTVPTAALDETLGLLSHCSYVVPLGRPFLRNLFSLLRHTDKMARISKEEIKLLGRWKSNAVDMYINELAEDEHKENITN